MFKCLECNAVYNSKPDYCECGNDTFESIYAQSAPASQTQQSQYYYAESAPAPVPKKPKNLKQILSNVIFGICIFLSICAWIFIGNGTNSSGTKHTDASGNHFATNQNIPQIEQVWDSTPPRAQKKIGVSTPSAPKNTAILNARMTDFGPEMRTYVVALGQTFVASWARGSVVGDGTCEIEFRVDNSGKIIDKKIVKPSNNSTMDDSIKLMMENVTQINPPPGEYKGERIVMAFNIQNRAYKVYYPQY